MAVGAGRLGQREQRLTALDGVALSCETGYPAIGCRGSVRSRSLDVRQVYDPTCGKAVLLVVHDSLNDLVVVAAVVFGRDRVLLGQRHDPRSRRVVWEFPGGKVEHGEDERSALVREIAEELGVRAVVRDVIARVWVPESPGCGVHVTHAGDSAIIAAEQRRFWLVAYCAQLMDQGVPESRVHRRLAWVSIGDLATLPMPGPDRHVCVALLMR